MSKYLSETFDQLVRGTVEGFAKHGKQYIRIPIGSARGRPPTRQRQSELSLPEKIDRENQEASSTGDSPSTDDTVIAYPKVQQRIAPATVDAEAELLTASITLTTHGGLGDVVRPFLNDRDIEARISRLPEKIWDSAAAFISHGRRRSNHQAAISLFAMISGNEQEMEAWRTLSDKGWVASIVSRAVFTDVLARNIILRVRIEIGSISLLSLEVSL